MQFNFVISTKEQAIRLWESLGFITSVVSRSPMPGEMHAIIGPNGDAGENRQGIRYCAPQATTSPHAYGKCMGWAELGRVCGCPPSTKCTAEQAHPDAEKAACVGKDIDKMKQKAHEAKPPVTTGIRLRSTSEPSNSREPLLDERICRLLSTLLAG